jgi:hypothetical protein
MSKLTNYSQEYIKYNNQLTNIEISNHPIINTIFSIIKNQYSKNYNFSYKILKIKKQHSTREYPNVYNYLKSNSIISIPNTFKKFVIWYTLNHHTLNINYSKLKSTNPNMQTLNELLYNHTFISLDIMQHIETSNLIYFKINYLNINLDIYIPITNNIKRINMKRKINEILHIILFMKQIGNNKNQTTNITLFIGKCKKIFVGSSSIHNNIISPINVNSGVTISRGNNKHIYIWREEELYKVLIHELIHYYDIDFKSNHPDYNILNDFINNTFSNYCNKNDLEKDAKGEAYTDFLAILIHVIYISYKLDNSLENIKKNVNIEIKFMLLQVAKLYLNTNKIYQTTSVFSYYVIKSMLFYNLNNSLEFFNKNLNIQSNIDLNKFINLITKSNNPEYWDEINKIKKNILQYNKNKFIFNTLRMSILQLE